MMRALIKVIGTRFYEQNSGMFLFVFYLMFGIVESSQLKAYHLSLMTGIVTSPMFLLVVCFIWALYGLKFISFFLSRLALPENQFLYRLNLLEQRQLLKSLLIVLLIMDLPMLWYALAAVGVGFHLSEYLSCIGIIVFHISLIFIGAWVIIRKLNRPHITSFRLPFPEIRWSRPRPFIFFYLNYLTGRLKRMLWITKAISVLAIVGFLQIPPDGYDPRIALLGLLFGLAAHLVIVFEFRRFEDQYLFFLRNMPLSNVSRFLKMAVVFLIILAPEAVLLLVNHLHVFDVAGILLFGVGFLMFQYASQYAGALDMDKHLTRLLGVFLVSFLLVLTRVYLAETVLFWCVSFYLYQQNYYAFEGAKG